MAGMNKLLILCATLALMAAFVPGTGRSQTAALEDFDGRWSFTRAQRDRDSLEDGIDHVADQLNLFIPSFVPKGLQVPLTVTSGANSTTVNVRVVE